LLAGYLGGWVDRVLMFVNDIFVAVPIFPILVLFYFVLRNSMDSFTMALIMACFGWPFDARLIRSVALGLKHREFTRHAVFAGMIDAQGAARRAPALCDADRVRHLHEQHALVDRHGGDAGRARLHQHQQSHHRHDALLGQQHSAMVVGVWWWIAIPVILIVITVPRPVPARHVASTNTSTRVAGCAGWEPDHGRWPATILTVEGLKAYYQMSYFGVNREVRAVDDITLASAAERSLRHRRRKLVGQDQLIKVLAAAIRPPLRVVAGSAEFDFGRQGVDVDQGDPARDRGDPLAAPELHHAGLDERAESGAPHRQASSRTSPPGRWACRAPPSASASSSTWGT
jgi:hypothetical protein